MNLGVGKKDKKDKKTAVKVKKEPPFGLGRFIILLILSAAFASSIIAISWINMHIEVADMNIETLNKLKKDYDFAFLEDNANQLRQSGLRLNAKSFTKNEAFKNTLSFADNLSKKYNAELTGNITTDNNVLTGQMKMTVTPKNPEEFLEVSNMLVTKRFPMVFIDSTAFEQLDKGTWTVKFEFTFFHPFEDEHGELDADF